MFCVRLHWWPVLGVTGMRQSKSQRSNDLAQWLRAQARDETCAEADLMARAAAALARIAGQRAPAIANDNHFVAKRRITR
jgi:hypothetical protein